MGSWTPERLRRMRTDYRRCASTSSSAPSWRLSRCRESLLIRTQEDPDDIFRVRTLLGEGSFGLVYLADMADNGSADSLAQLMEVAIKVVPCSASAEKELRILKDLAHPNIVQYFGTWVKDSQLWIAMEFCEGGSVCDAMGRLGRGLYVQEIRAVTSGALRGLAYLHEKNVIHRDIKGDNLLLTAQGAKLADFGVSAKVPVLCSLMDPKDPTTSYAARDPHRSGHRSGGLLKPARLISCTLMPSTQRRRNDLTCEFSPQVTGNCGRRGTMTGTPYWMAPEVCASGTYDVSADIWSLGITVVEMILTLPPLASLHPQEAMQHIQSSAAPLRDSRIPTCLEPTLRDFIQCCIHPDPEQRPRAQTLLAHPLLVGAEAHDYTNPQTLPLHLCGLWQESCATNSCSPCARFGPNDRTCSPAFAEIGVHVGTGCRYVGDLTGEATIAASAHRGQGVDVDNVGVKDETVLGISTVGSLSAWLTMGKLLHSDFYTRRRSTWETATVHARRDADLGARPLHPAGTEAADGTEQSQTDSHRTKFSRSTWTLTMMLKEQPGSLIPASVGMVQTCSLVLSCLNFQLGLVTLSCDLTGNPWCGLHHPAAPAAAVLRGTCLLCTQSIE